MNGMSGIFNKAKYLPFKLDGETHWINNEFSCLSVALVFIGWPDRADAIYVKDFHNRFQTSFASAFRIV